LFLNITRKLSLSNDKIIACQKIAEAHNGFYQNLELTFSILWKNETRRRVKKKGDDLTLTRFNYAG